MQTIELDGHIFQLHLSKNTIQIFENITRSFIAVSSRNGSVVFGELRCPEHGCPQRVPGLPTILVNTAIHILSNSNVDQEEIIAYPSWPDSGIYMKAKRRSEFFSKFGLLRTHNNSYEKYLSIDFLRRLLNITTLSDYNSPHKSNIKELKIAQMTPIWSQDIVPFSPHELRQLELTGNLKRGGVS